MPFTHQIGAGAAGGSGAVATHRRAHLLSHDRAGHVRTCVPDGRRGRAAGVASAGLQTAQGVGVLLAGALAELMAPPRAMGVCAAAGVRLAVVLAMALPHDASSRTTAPVPGDGSAGSVAAPGQAPAAGGYPSGPASGRPPCDGCGRAGGREAVADRVDGATARPPLSTVGTPREGGRSRCAVSSRLAGGRGRDPAYRAARAVRATGLDRGGGSRWGPGAAGDPHGWSPRAG